MKHIFYYLSIFLLTIFQSAMAQTWTQKAPFPFAGNEGGGSFTIGTKIYFASGKDRSFYQYDPGSNTWTKKADLPGTSTRGGFVAFAVSGMGYVGLGLNDAGVTKADFWQYDPVADSWAQKANYPGGGRVYSGCFVIDSLAYVGAGADETGAFFNDFYQYNPSTNSWTKRANIQAGGGYSKVAGPSAFSIGEYGYFVGGEFLTTDFHVTARYDPLNNKWATKASVPGNGRTSGSGFSNGQLGFVGFGEAGFTTAYDDFYSYDPSTDSWQPLGEFPTKAGRAYAAAAVLGNNAYVGGGWDLGTNYFNDWWQLSLPVPALIPHIAVSLSQIDFGSLNSTASRDTTMNIQAGPDTNLVISGMQVSGSGSTAYSIKNPPAFPYTLAAGKNLSVTISFKPADTGTFDATLTITSDAELEAAHTTPVSLHGTAFSLTPHLLLSSAKIDFGKVNLNTSVDSTLTITAGQNADLKISNIQITDPANVFLLKSAPAFPFTVSAGKTLKIGITFKPTTNQLYDATATITSNAENDAAHLSPVALHGEGTGTDAVTSESVPVPVLELKATPNPFAQSITLSLINNEGIPSQIMISVIDALGNEVMNIGGEEYGPGYNTIRIEMQNLSSGKYWVVAKTSSNILRIPLVKVR